MTNKEQRWSERLAILKDVLVSLIPGFVIFGVFLGLFFVTGRMDGQWQAGLSNKRSEMNALAVSNLKDFATLQTNQSDINYLPRGLDADRVARDSEEFLVMADLCLNWEGYEGGIATMERFRQIYGENDAVEMILREAVFRPVTGNQFMHSLIGGGMSPVGSSVGATLEDGSRGRLSRVMGNKADLDSVSTYMIEIMEDGRYMYLSFVPVYKWFEKGEYESWAGLEVEMCAAFWWKCDSAGGITPVSLEWVETGK